MDFTEIVGFIITMAAIIYMFIKRAKDLRQRRSQPEEEDDEQEQAEKLQDFLKSLEIDMEKSEDFKPPPKPKVIIPTLTPKYQKPKPRPVYKQEPIQSTQFKSDLDDFQMKTNIEDRKLKISTHKYGEEGYGEHLLRPEFRGEKLIHLMHYKKASRIKNLIKTLPSKKDIVLLHEVLDKPKGLKF